MKRPNFNWKLPPAIEARLGTESYGSQRAIHEDQHLLLVLHEPPAGDQDAREAAVFLRQPNGKWLYHGVDNGDFALKQLLDRYRAKLTALDEQGSKTVNADDLFQILDQAIPLARSASNMKEALQAAREMIKLDPLLIDARDQAVDLARGLELLVADARLTLDYRLARNAEEQVQASLAVNRAQQKLNVLAALTFPLMTLATVFGMNLRSGMENLPTLAFWGIFAVGIAFGLSVRRWVDPGVAPPKQSVPRTLKR
jgi:hypothetical protein